MGRRMFYSGDRPGIQEDAIMAEHKQGDMDITEQERTFAGFMTVITRGAILIIIALILLALINA